MKRYADPHSCPDCRGPIAFGAAACPRCGLSLSGPLAGQLFQALTRADDLLNRMRAASVQPATAAAPPPAAATTRAAASAAPSAAVGAVPASRRSGLGAASVPKILLGLGALCLLVAALVFLAVSWSAMGVAGRTATLVGLTLVGAGLTAWMARRGLRAATESLSLVTLGLLAFDLVGAEDSGWLGALDVTGFLLLLGSVVALAGAAATLAVRRTPAADLGGAQVVTLLGAWVAGAGFVTAEWLPLSARLTVAVLAALVVTVAVHRLRLVLAAVGIGTLSGLLWVVLTGVGLERAFGRPSAGELWLELEVWPLLAAAVLAAAAGPVRGLPLWARVAGVAVGELLLTVAVLVPFTQGTATELTLAVLGALAVSCLLAWQARGWWAAAPAATATPAAVWALGAVVGLGSVALERVGNATARPWAGEPAGRFGEIAMVDPAAWLLPVATVAVLGYLVVLARVFRVVDRLLAPAADASVLTGLVMLSLVGTVASYPVPVWLVTGLLLVSTAALVGWGMVREAGVPLATGAVFAALAVATAGYDEWHTAVALTVLVVLAGTVHLVWRRAEVGAVAGGLGVLALGGLVWTVGALADAGPPATGLVGVLLVASVTLGAPYLPDTWWQGGRAATVRVGLEWGALATGSALALAGVARAVDSERADWLAGYLTALGVAAAAMALLRTDRRAVGWLGGALLAAASWVRLADAGVEGPEAYTLPSAVALLVLGVYRLVRDDASGTMTALAPGLSLALVPTLLWALVEPVSPRALLLGAGCLLLVLVGLRLRWTAPVVLGAAVGALLVVRHAAPFVDQAVPRWVLIGAAGAVLIAVGVTWERRLQEARSVVGYVRALR